MILEMHSFQFQSRRKYLYIMPMFTGYQCFETQCIIFVSYIPYLEFVQTGYEINNIGH